MHIYRFYDEQKLPIAIDEGWNFFSNPQNLLKITPPYMKFRITNNPGKDIFSGMIITYKVSPLFNISLNWVTEIVYADKPNYFIDEQRFGPYKFWHHKHSFTAIPEGMLMKDEIYYALPLGIIGQIIHSMIIKNRLRKIFSYRKKSLNKIFPERINAETT